MYYSAAYVFFFFFFFPSSSSSSTPPTHPPPQIILADVEDAASLEKMASRARVVLNCVGPYRFYGEQV